MKSIESLNERTYQAVGELSKGILLLLTLITAVSVYTIQRSDAIIAATVDPAQEISDQLRQAQGEFFSLSFSRMVFTFCLPLTLGVFVYAFQVLKNRLKSLLVSSEISRAELENHYATMIPSNLVSLITHLVSIAVTVSLLFHCYAVLQWSDGNETLTLATKGFVVVVTIVGLAPAVLLSFEHTRASRRAKTS